MACEIIESSSSSRMIRKYDVFVSFRGETRNGFISHLFGAFDKKSIVTFRDNKNLNKGKEIGPELLQAIEGSRVFVVVFSENYASSTWCLRELAKIHDYMNVPENCVLPVFCGVDPSEVRKQSGNYEKAFVKHEEKFKGNLEKLAEVQRWRKALTQVANLSGWDLRDKPQYEEIQKIVEKIISILGPKFSSHPNDLVGISSRVEELEKLLALGSDDKVQVVGIWGMGGIGKTTLATALYDKISHHYEARCYVDDISEIYEACGRIGVQKQFLCQALNEKNLDIRNHWEGTSLVRSRLCHVKAFVVLDNVKQFEQLENLAVNRECLGAGSKIIIISRDEHIFKNYEVDRVYNVQLLNEDEALQLFCKKAFKCDYIWKDYEELTRDALKYANGLPLAIKVLGSFLYGRVVSVWRSELARMKENPSQDIMGVLRTSYEALGEKEKEIFLDIACFFNRSYVHRVKGILDCCGFYPDIGIDVLVNKSLITIKNYKIIMHDLLKELGQNIVRQNSPGEPGKWSRLWRCEDYNNVMLENTQNKHIEAIQLQNIIHEEILTFEALSKMSCLRYLSISCLKISGSLNCLSNELRYLDWHLYPFTCLPSSFEPKKLVELCLSDSSIKHLWKGIKNLPKLKTMDLRGSRNLIKTPDFTRVPKLKRLILRECTKLVRIHPSIGLLRELNHLDLENCKNLVNIPNLLDLSSLEYLNLSGCSKVFNNQLLDKPRQVEHLKKLDMQSQSTSSILKSFRLPVHFFYSRTHKYSPSCWLPSLPSFTCLRNLDLSFCNLHQIPDDIGRLHNLESLNLGGNNFVGLPCSLKELSKLMYLNLEHCKQLKYLSALPLPTVLPERSESYFYDDELELNIFNCPKLGEMNNCRSMAFSWMVHALQVLHKYSVSAGQINLVISGSQIPRWFNNQFAGCSMRIGRTPNLHDNNWIGFACCFVFVAPDRNVDIMYCFTGDHGSCGHTAVHLRGGRGLVTGESDHQWLLYLTKKQFLDFEHHDQMTEANYDLDGIKMYAEIFHTHYLHLEVKSCGYRWVFEQDLEQLNSTMTSSGSSSSSSNQILDDLGIGDPILYSEATNSSVQSPKFLTMD